MITVTYQPVGPGLLTQLTPHILPTNWQCAASLGPAFVIVIANPADPPTTASDLYEIPSINLYSVKISSIRIYCSGGGSGTDYYGNVGFNDGMWPTTLGKTASTAALKTVLP